MEKENITTDRKISQIGELVENMDRTLKTIKGILQFFLIVFILGFLASMCSVATVMGI